MRDQDRERTARLLFGAELAAGTVRPAALAAPPPHRAALPLRVLERVAMKTGRLTYETASAAPQDAVRRAVLGPAAAGPPRFLVRVDEFPHYRAFDEPVRYGADRFERFHDVLAARGVPYLIAALPSLAADPLDPAATGGRALDGAEAAMLGRLAAEGVTLALHGYDHRTRRRSPRRRSELAGLDAGALNARLDAGEAVLRALGLPRPRVFVPPYNRFGRAQYPALAARYDVVAGGPESVVAMGAGPTPAWRGEAVYLPAYPPLYGTAAEVLPAARALTEAGRALWVPVVLHWGWEADGGLRDMRALADALAPCAARWDDFLAAVEASR